MTYHDYLRIKPEPLLLWTQIGPKSVAVTTYCIPSRS
jgi:hypothetical protein